MYKKRYNRLIKKIGKNHIKKENMNYYYKMMFFLIFYWFNSSHMILCKNLVES